MAILTDRHDTFGEYPTGSATDDRWNVCSLIPRAWTIWPIVFSAASIVSASRSFRMICSGVCRFPCRFFTKSLLSPPRGFGYSHNAWTRFWISFQSVQARIRYLSDLLVWCFERIFLKLSYKLSSSLVFFFLQFHNTHLTQSISSIHDLSNSNCACCLLLHILGC